ncbi:hypothetical protein [Leptospira noguchii]|uniref:hypothetical protein n=1 Tax=Leptospira noguchii TaxID=28182 RepID=UPI000773EAC0|nr:hypothetical protein [Leptospira noguchii]
MRRTRAIKTKKSDGTPGVIHQDFYNKTLVSTANIKGGSIKLFQSSNTLVLNHAKSDSPMPTKKGSVIVMHAQIMAPDYGILQFDSTNVNVLNDLEIFRNTFELEFKIGNETIHEDALSTLIEPMPMIFKTTDQGTANNVIRPAIQAIPRKAESVWMKRSGQLIIPFDRPIPVKDEVFSLELRPMENAGNPTTLIEPYKIQFRIGAANDLVGNKVARG